jgi:hypothetical protein
MKTRFVLWIVLCGFGSWLTSAVCASDPGVTNPAPRPVWYVLGLSPFLDAESKDPLFREIVRFLLEDAPLNSSVIVHDAFHVRTIARIDIPDLTAFRSAKTRANQFRDPIRKLKSFLAADPPRPDTAELDFDGALRLPQFLDFVSENLGGSDHELAVLVLGSPLYLDEKEPGFSMVDGYYPSDGHLTASREQSVYGIQQRAEALPGVTVHLGWFGDPWVSALHQEKIGRFWSLYLQGQGAGLGSFCGDLSTVFDALRGDAASLQARATRYQLDPAQTRIEMLRITREIGVADWITRDTLPGGPQRPPTITVG